MGVAVALVTGSKLKGVTLASQLHGGRPMGATMPSEHKKVKSCA